MKKNHLFFAVSLVLILNSCTSSQVNLNENQNKSKKGSEVQSVSEKRGKGIRITIPTPSFYGSTENDNWIPVLLQDLLTSNISECSDMTVIDRFNEQLILNEQRHSEEEMFSDENAIELGNITNAQYVAAVNIINTEGKYNVSVRIIDVETNEIKSSCNELAAISEIQNGRTAKLAAKEILTQFGINLTEAEIKKLSGSEKSLNESKKIESAVNLAKGMAAQDKNNNIVEALSYYYGSEEKEAEKRFNELFNSVVSGNIREDSKNEIALRKAWLKNYDDLQSFLTKHMITLSYDARPGNYKINYEEETVSIPFTWSWNLDANAFTIYRNFEEGLDAMGKRNSWSASSNNGQRSNFKIEWPEYTVDFVLKNADEKVIARKSVYVDSSEKISEGNRCYSEYRKKINSVSNNYSSTSYSPASDVKNEFIFSERKFDANEFGLAYTDDTVTFSDIYVDDIDDNMSFCIERITVNDIVNPPVEINVTGQLSSSTDKSISNPYKGDIKPSDDPVPYDFKKYDTGDKGPAGGIVFWANRSGVTINGKQYHYMEVCPVFYRRSVKKRSNSDFAADGIEYSYEYKEKAGNVKSIYGQQINQEMGHGFEATNALIYYYYEDKTAFSLEPVVSCNYGGYTDWFIPNLAEANEFSWFLTKCSFESRLAHLKKYVQLNDSVFEQICTFAGSINFYHQDENDNAAAKGLTVSQRNELPEYEKFMLVRYF